MSLSHHIPQQLQTSKLSVNSVIKNRSTRFFNPINGQNAYGSGKKEIEFQISHQDLFDFSTMALFFNFSGTDSDGDDLELDDGASSVIQTVEVYLADQLIERVEQYGLLTQAMTLATSNDSYYTRELNAMSGVHRYADGLDARQGDFVMDFGILGISKVAQYVPVYQNNLRIVIKLASGAVACGKNADYALNGVKIICDTVEPIESYRDRLNAMIRSEEGISIPLQTFDVKTRAFEPQMNFNLSYAEMDSLYGLVKQPTGTEWSAGLALPNLKSLNVNMNGKYFSMPPEGLTGLVQPYMAMRKSLAQLHNADGTTMLDFDTYKNELTLLGVDCEKVPAHNEVYHNGVSTRDLGYSLDVAIDAGATLPNNTKFYLAVLHRKLVKMAGNAVMVVE